MYGQNGQQGYGYGGQNPNQFNQGPVSYQGSPSPQFGGQPAPGYGGFNQGGYANPDGTMAPNMPYLGGPNVGPGFAGPGPSNPYQGYNPNPGFGGPQTGFGGPQPGVAGPNPGIQGPQYQNPIQGPNSNFGNQGMNQFAPTPGPNGVPGSIELKFRCENLRNRDTFGKSDPFIQAELVSKGQKINLGRTESINNDLSPTFQKTIPAPYNFELPQELTVLVYDSDAMTENDLIGRGTCLLNEVIANRTGSGHMITLGGTNGLGSGVVYIAYDKVPVSRKAYIFNICCSEVRDIEVFSKSDPFLRISRASDRAVPGTDPSKLSSQDWTLAYESEVKSNDLNPLFQEFIVNGSKLCRNNIYIPIKLEIFDYSNTGAPTLIGKAFSSVAKITAGERRFTTYDDQGRKGGDVIINQCQEIVEYDIIDYLRNGLKIGLSFAIDFTGSNGNPSSNNSLHHIEQGMNAYQAAISQVGKSLLPFDTDKLIPAYGFGAKIGGTYSDCFPLGTGACDGVQGLLQAYAQAVRSVELWGPTNFTPVIHKAQEAARQLKATNPMHYLVLVILTDGQITDFSETKNELVACADLPMSVIIIGVGSENFSQMDALDGDGGRLVNSQGKLASRDIVQFVELKKIAQNDYSIAEAVLQELPGHINLYYYKQGFSPKL
jgi:Copine/C2 domain